ncbi:MAG TPA: alpha/beta fold hydrolase [Methylotenera sp.]|nr:alpha/beta fold hydrolase [Methylotenera sp.]
MTYKHPLELISRDQNNNNQSSLSTVDNSKINASVIWLHGLGADGYDFEPIVKQLELPNIRFILPHAPEIAVSINSGYVMPAWYDLYGLTAGSFEDEAGIRASHEYVNSLIEIEIERRIPAKRIVLAGFSQGGAIALHTALRHPQKLGGVLALSTYLPLKLKLADEAHTANTDTPIFMAHGIFDEVISLDTCKISLNLLQNRQYSVTWRTYNMAHSVCAEEIADIRDFLQQVLVE